MCWCKMRGGQGIMAWTVVPIGNRPSLTRSAIEIAGFKVLPQGILSGNALAI